VRCGTPATRKAGRGIHSHAGKPQPYPPAGLPDLPRARVERTGRAGRARDRSRQGNPQKRVPPIAPPRYAPVMQLSRLLEELTRAAERAGIKVRSEVFDPNLSDVKRPRGGLCTLRGARLLLIDAKLPLPERIAIVAEALAAVDLDHLFLPPIVRATIGAYAAPKALDGYSLPPSGAPANDSTGPPAPLPLARARRRDEA
jgi:hypothetical protein